MNKVYCFFSARYLPYLGGVERYTYNLARELVSFGNKVIIVTSHIGNEPTYEEQDKVKIYRLPSFRLLKGRFPIVKYNKETRKVFAAIRQQNIDYVIINTRFYWLSYVGSVFSKRNRIPTIVIEHGTGHFTVNNIIFDFGGHVYEHFISYLLKRNVQNYYGVSNECNKWLKHFKISSKGVLYNSIDKNQIENLYMTQNKEIEDRIEYDKKDIVITFTGRLIKEKGILKLISAFKIVHDKYPNAKLCIAGNGDLYNEISKRCDDGIYLLGKLSFENVVSLLKITSIFCLPTDYPEGLPTSILEAIVCKCYVITSSSGGAKEIISNPAYGTVLEQNNINEIKRALLESITDSKKRIAAVENSYKRVCNEFTWRKTADTLIEIFENEI